MLSCTKEQVLSVTELTKNYSRINELVTNGEVLGAVRLLSRGHFRGVDRVTALASSWTDSGAQPSALLLIVTNE